MKWYPCDLFYIYNSFINAPSCFFFFVFSYPLWPYIFYVNFPLLAIDLFSDFLSFQLNTHTFVNRHNLHVFFVGDAKNGKNMFCFFFVMVVCVDVLKCFSVVVIFKYFLYLFSSQYEIYEKKNCCNTVTMLTLPQVIFLS